MRQLFTYAFFVVWLVAMLYVVCASAGMPPPEGKNKRAAGALRKHL